MIGRSASLVMGTGNNLFATKNISKMRSSKEPLEASLLLSCSKNSNHRIGFQLTCTANSPLLLNMKMVVEGQNFLHSIIAFQGACRYLSYALTISYSSTSQTL
ncbi:hypothetical protein Gotur_024228 [Gossypium turneri]